MPGAPANARLGSAAAALDLRPRDGSRADSASRKAAGHAQGPAQPGYLELLAMPPNERVLHGSSRAKYAAAFFRMSRSSVTFSSSRFRRATSFSSDAGLRPGP